MAQPQPSVKEDAGTALDDAAQRRILAETGDTLRRAEEGIGAVLTLTAESAGRERLIAALLRSPIAAGFGVARWPQSPLPPLGGRDDLEAVARTLLPLTGGNPAEAPRRVALAAERGGGELAGEAVRGLLDAPSLHPLWLGLDRTQRADFQVEGLAAAVLDLCYERPVLILVENAEWTRGLTHQLLDALAAAAEDARLCLLLTRSPAHSDDPGGWTAPVTARRIVLQEPDGGPNELADTGADDLSGPAFHAHALDSLRRERRSGRIEWMAHHAPLAGNWMLACACARHAGRRAEEGCRPADAARHYMDALNALDRLPDSRRNAQRRIDLWTALARTRVPLGHGNRSGDAAEAAETANALAVRLDDRLRTARALSLLAALNWAGGDLRAAQRTGMRALRIWRRTDSPGPRIQTLIRVGRGLTEQGRFRHADTVLRAAAQRVEADDARRLPGPTALAPVCVAAHRARCLAELGEPDEALRLAQAAAALAEESGHAASRALACLHLGWAALTSRRFDHAMAPLKQAVAITETIRLHACQPLALGALGYALVRAGSLADGASLLLGSREHARLLGIARHEPQILIWIAEAALLSGQPEDAVRNAREAAGRAGAAGQSGDEAWARLVLSRGLAATDDIAAAQRQLAAAVRIAAQRSMATLIIQCSTLREALAPE
ncbi:hypothetical protein [Roseomonas genomospecies 6]|uniref:Tetratricopeptide repeat protein n=1 Tax=Roseomonas genomospecies 6 TaxID=214106 RepID=A0A9W7KP83_9PROT|nr:hypothetical protein [Roseomonas genomospecies 6]KAA0675850.1 hypothetical protein DS843_29660 [Roseomonas genomospecies 6]